MSVPKNTSVSLGAPLADFVAQCVASGRYGNASEVVREGLRLLEEREHKLQQMRRDLEVKGREHG